MYKCTDCGQEYNVKPDYCDCGNDVFENTQKTEEVTVHKEIPVAVIAPTPQAPLKKPFDTMSLIIFLSCIILSILAIVFIGNESQDKPSKANSTRYEKATETKEIPSINKLWQEPQPLTPSEPLLPEPKAETTPVPILKPTPKALPVKKVQASPSQKSSTLIVPKPTVNKVNPAVAQQEFVKYKIALRNRIASDINFAAVVGDGACVVSFKIDSSGNLTSRAFVKQSDNDSLNDAVYAAIMQNPSFKTPPSAYKKETLKLSVKMYGGNYEVSLY